VFLPLLCFSLIVILGQKGSEAQPDPGISARPPTYSTVALLFDRRQTAEAREQAEALLEEGLTPSREEHLRFLLAASEPTYPATQVALIDFLGKHPSSRYSRRALEYLTDNYWIHGEYEEAEHHFTQLARQVTRSWVRIECLVQAAECQILAGKFAEGRKALLGLLSQVPEMSSGRIRAGLARSYLIEEDRPTAESQYLEIVRRYRGQDVEGEARLALAEIYMKLKETRKAESQLRDLIVSFPRSAEAVAGRQLLEKLLEERPAIHYER